MIFRWVSLSLTILFLSSCSSFEVSPGAYHLNITKHDTRASVKSACDRMGGEANGGCAKEVARGYWIIHTLATFDCLIHEIRHAEQGHWHDGELGC